MMSFNFLSDTDRHRIFLQNVFWGMRFWVVWIILLVVASIIIIGGIAVAVYVQTQIVSAQVEALFSQQLLRDIAEKEQKIVQWNNRLNAADVVLSNRASVHDLILEITALLPDGATLDTLVFNREEQTMVLGGHAALRSQVLDAEQALRAHPRIQDVEAPVANILESQDVDFAFTLIVQ